MTDEKPDFVPDSAVEYAAKHYVVTVDHADEENPGWPVKKRLATWRDAPTNWGEVADLLDTLPAPVDVWEDGYSAAKTMARAYGHTDHWEDPEPKNPYK